MTVSVARLEHWLMNDPDRLERYLTRHPEAADLLESATELASDIRSALFEAVQVPSDLYTRLLADVRGAGDSGPGTIVMDVLGGGVAAVKVMLGLDADPA
jgi:hypothetical protein